MVFRAWWGSTLAFVFLAATGPACHAGVIYSLGAPKFLGNSASFDILVNYSDTPPFEMVFLGIDARQSSSALAPVNPGTGKPDFSAFDFIPSSILGSSWGPVGSAFPGEFLYQTPPPPGLVPPDGLPPNATYLVGTLTYDLSKFGITPSDSLFVSIMGTDTVIGTEDPSDPTTFGFVNPSFNPGSQRLQSGGGGTVPEPTAFSLLVVGSLLVFAVRCLRIRTST
jgi:hypothetical protein